MNEFAINVCVYGSLGIGGLANEVRMPSATCTKLSTVIKLN